MALASELAQMTKAKSRAGGTMRKWWYRPGDTRQEATRDWWQWDAENLDPEYILKVTAEVLWLDCAECEKGRKDDIKVFDLHPLLTWSWKLRECSFLPLGFDTSSSSPFCGQGSEGAALMVTPSFQKTTPVSH